MSVIWILRTSRCLALLAALFLCGCHRPLLLSTSNRVSVDGPVETRLQFMPVADGSAVTAVPLQTGCDIHAGPRVAIVDVDGLLVNMDCQGPYSLGENPVAIFREKLEAVAADPNVCAVVLRINSPGGSVTASDIMWHDLQAFRNRTHLPVIACLMDVAAGGAYYLATGTDRIVAHPTTVTGGIGVILNLYNLRDLMAQLNILSQGIKAGPHIDMGTPTRNLPDETRVLLQKMADEFHQRFTDVVRQARPQIDSKRADTFDGRVFTAREALGRHLLDRIGYLDDAIALAAERGGHVGVQAVLYRRRNDPAHSPYAVTPNVPLQATAWPLNIPGLDRSRLPTFLYLWQPETALERLGGQ